MKTIAALTLALALAVIGPAAHAAAAPVPSLKGEVDEKSVLALGERSPRLRATRPLKGVEFSGEGAAPVRPDFVKGGVSKQGAPCT